MNLLDSVIESMEDNEMIFKHSSEDGDEENFRFMPLVSPVLTKLLASETEIIDKVLFRFVDWNWNSFVSYSLEDSPVQNANIGDVINYKEVNNRVLSYNITG